MTDLNKIINEQRERIAELQQENTLLLAKTLPECNCEGLQQRIAELETELDKAYNDLANFEGYPEEVSALRHDIERRKQRYKNILLDRAEWKKRAESAEKRLAEVERELENERMISMKRFIDSGRADRFAIEQQIKALDEFALVPLGVANHHCPKEVAGYMWLHDALTGKLNQLHQQLNGGE
tara:strand:+ start:46442 stop:46987 length:546 start_codon:yes stop_codon:yes gene_type:complete